MTPGVDGKTIKSYIDGKKTLARRAFMYGCPFMMWWTCVDKEDIFPGLWRRCEVIDIVPRKKKIINHFYNTWDCIIKIHPDPLSPKGALSVIEISDLVATYFRDRIYFKDSFPAWDKYFATHYPHEWIK